VNDHRSESTKLVGCKQCGGTGSVRHYISVGCCEWIHYRTLWNITRQHWWLLQLRGIHADHVGLHSRSWKQPRKCTGNDENMTMTITIFKFCLTREFLLQTRLHTWNELLMPLLVASILHKKLHWKVIMALVSNKYCGRNNKRQLSTLPLFPGHQTATILRSFIANAKVCILIVWDGLTYHE